MSDRPETTDDIIREMRELGALDAQCNDMIPRSLQALGLRTYAGRLEAATKREKVEAVNTPGNAAALREALVGVLSALEAVGFRPLVEGDPLAEAVLKARAALAAPARNCDRFTDEVDAQLAFLNEVWLISVTRETMLERDRFDNWTCEMRSEFARWLFAPAEGGAK